ncbi:5-oxoprolinase subunit PxpB [Nitrincola sp.]|uniref:5-oxoprolinase subunit PxpB n=1 Tax=Nitrincola sp. TaxID=1926584 RepID=UPI003A914C6A
MHWSAETAGVNALLLRFGDAMSPELSARIHQVSLRLQNSLGDRILNLTPAYTTLLIEYDLLQDTQTSLLTLITPLLNNLSPDTPLADTDPINIPVYYDPHTTGPDLTALAEQKNCTVEDIIQRHCDQEYRVYALGFAPGFAYMGETHPDLRITRLETPRVRVPAGSVAIADNQTAIYPIDSPGGWRLLGRTPMKLFNVQADPPALLQPGQRVRFHPVDRETFIQLGGELDDQFSGKSSHD